LDGIRKARFGGDAATSNRSDVRVTALARLTEDLPSMAAAEIEHR
jgi:hypothetical protein